MSLLNTLSNSLTSTIDAAFGVSNKNYFTNQFDSELNLGGTQYTGLMLQPLDVSVSELIGKLTSDGTGSGIKSILKDIHNDYLNRDNLNEWLFRHFLEDSNASYPYRSLSNFQNTPSDNEDPVSFGYDIIINYATSPLFNGGIEEFIDMFGKSYVELGSRMDLVKQFKEQLFKFFKVDSPGSLGYNNQRLARTYYLKKISGLDSLSETINSDKPKQFVDYGNDYLTLTLNEDVNINMGYLASIYRILTWSRINGKKMFPDNLLRFDMDIVVTEARKYTRLYNDNGNIIEYADLISRYVYKVYECQFFFEKLSHDDAIDMSALDISAGFDLKINFKFSTLKFEWLKTYDFNNAIVSQIKDSAFLNNGSFNLTSNSTRVYDLTYVDSAETQNATIGSTITANVATYDLNPLQSIHYGSNSGIKVNLRDKLLKKTLDNLSAQYGMSLSNLGGILLGSILSGFTDDGYTYNKAAYYLNKTLNSFNNTLSAALGNAGSNITTKIEGNYNFASLTDRNGSVSDGFQYSTSAYLLNHQPFEVALSTTTFGNYSGKFATDGWIYANLPTNRIKQITPTTKILGHYNETFGPDGWEYDLKDWTTNEAESSLNNFVTPTTRVLGSYNEEFGADGWQYDLADWIKNHLIR